MTPDEPADVIGNLPRTRPSRRSPRRAARATPSAGTTPSTTSSAKAPTPAKPASDRTTSPPKVTVAKPKAAGRAKAKPAAKGKAKAKPAARARATEAGKVRGVTKTSAARKVADRTQADARARATAKAAEQRPPIPPAGYAVPGAQPAAGSGLNLAETVRGAAQLAETGVAVLRGLLGR